MIFKFPFIWKTVASGAANFNPETFVQSARNSIFTFSFSIFKFTDLWVRKLMVCKKFKQYLTVFYRVLCYCKWPRNLVNYNKLTKGSLDTIEQKFTNLSIRTLKAAKAIVPLLQTFLHIFIYTV